MPSAFSAGGASEGVAGAPAAGAAAGAGGGVWAMTGALAKRAKAPMSARMDEVRFVSSICRRFLLIELIKKEGDGAHAPPGLPRC